MSDRLDLRTRLMLAVVALIVLVVYAGTRIVFGLLTPTVCASSMTLDEGGTTVVNAVTCS